MDRLTQHDNFIGYYNTFWKFGILSFGSIPNGKTVCEYCDMQYFGKSCKNFGIKQLRGTNSLGYCGTITNILGGTQS